MSKGLETPLSPAKYQLISGHPLSQFIQKICRREIEIVEIENIEDICDGVKEEDTSIRWLCASGIGLSLFGVLAMVLGLV